MTKPCVIQGCTGISKGRGLCPHHWQQAKRDGTLESFPTKPLAQITNCPHTDRKHVGHGRCGSCATKYWESQNPNHNSGNKWLKNNPEKAKHHLKKNHIKKMYGLTHEQHQAMWDKQGGKCANPACDFVSPALYAPMIERLDVDHDHKTGAIRGLLCRPCNQALSRVGDDIARLRGLIAYLESKV